MTLSSPADRSKLESDAEMFFDQVGRCCSSLGIAWPSGLELKLPDGTRVMFSRPKLKGRAVTEREKEFLRAVVLPMFWEYCMSLPVTGANQEKIKRKKDQYEKTVFGKLRNDKDKRAGAEFWMRWQNALLCHQENPTRVSFVIAPMRMERATPKFWQGFFQAMRTSASYGNKEPTDKWLIEHEEEVKNLTPREVKEQFGSKFQATSVEKLHERMQNLGLAHRHEPRGKASPNYRQFRRGA
jgi:hypothetical protein